MNHGGRGAAWCSGLHTSLKGTGTMQEADLKKLRRYYRSLQNQKRVFDALTSNTDHYSVEVLEKEIKQVEQDFPNLLPEFNRRDFLSYQNHQQRIYRYDVTGLQAYLATVVGRLEIEIEQDTTAPVTEHREFTFVNNSDLRSILERDYEELQRAFITNCWKSTLILCGGMIEAILTDLLLANDARAKSAAAAPKQPDISRWGLSDLIGVSVELKLVTDGVKNLSHPLRGYRNLVHPGNEARQSLTFDAEEARIAVEIVNMVHRDLSP